MAAIPVVERKAQEYKTQDGNAPFRDWLIELKDSRAKAKVTKAVTQMEAGNFGDHKPITDGNGLQERRIDYGPGYRIYYITEGDELIILFAGSDKSDQQAAIDAAKDYLADYKARKPKVAPYKLKTGNPSSKRRKRKGKK
ncbi:type II toxin-antitoxin system RelE/ParE family toxin [Teredinibacter turnerae]|uniref:type II toxin-antitoxin system RelE/ParE family toxin n=1 Tax=Teredinibacter turnerae TaxID=2426 RepID=UPI00055E19EC|nr:type II toxin-antitoxin system RelE/ParE family toxin [Teredinibacter turnerae]